MGLILDPTPDMAPWRTEVRSRSAYISGGAVWAHRTEGEELHTGFAVRVDQARPLIAALDQILNHPWSEPLAGPPPGPAATWTIATDDDWFQLVGPCYVYGAQGGDGWAPSSVAMVDGTDIGMFELAHWDIQEVRNRIGATLYRQDETARLVEQAKAKLTDIAASETD
jgi:hypothetical protein